MIVGCFDLGRTDDPAEYVLQLGPHGILSRLVLIDRQAYLYILSKMGIIR